MTDVPAYISLPSKEEIKERLPLAYVCSRLGIRLEHSGGMAICPFHDDHAPSFYLYEREDGTINWYCQPCGFGGDVFSLVQRTYNCTFPEALQFAAELLEDLPPGYVTPDTPKRVREPRPDEMETVVTPARLRAAQTDHAGYMAVHVGLTEISEVALAVKWDHYLRKVWGWGIDEVGNIVMPHWNTDKMLVGCKIRKQDGSRASVPGSVYNGQLYGAWLGRRHKDVLLTEGETDCVFADWLAREEEISIDVFSLPAGANEDVEPPWIEFVKRSRRIYLAFDPDAVGVAATWKWIKALETAGVKDLRTCCLPLGKDIRDARPVLSQLLEDARTPDAQPEGIVATPGGYTRPTKDDAYRRVTNWTLDPVAKLAGGEEPGFDVTLRHRGTKKQTIIRLSDLAGTREIKRWCNRHDLIFTGRDDDLQRIAEYVTWRGSVVPEVYQTDQVGLHEPPDTYQFAGPSVVFPNGYLGKMPWRYVPSAKTADVTGKILLPSVGRFHWNWLEDFLHLSSEQVTHPLLSWVVASSRRPDAAQFPLLFIGGSSGVGKSTLARLALRLAGSQVEIDLGNVTPFILVRTLATSSSLPIFIDEWTKLSRRDAREAFQGSIPVLYAGGTAERGQADLSSTVYRLTTPVIVAGEDTFMLDRELERMITIGPTRGSQNHDALTRLRDKPIERFGQLLHGWLAGKPDLPSLQLTESTRTEYNKQVLQVGWQTLRALLHEAGRFEEVPEIPDEPDLTALDIALERDDENVYDQALLVGASMTDNDRHPVVWADREGRGTWVRFQVLTGLLQTRNVDIALPGGSRSMKAYFEENHGKCVLGPSETPPNSFTSLRAWLIPGHQLPGDKDPRALGYMPT